MRSSLHLNLQHFQIDCRYQGLALKFRLLSIYFALDPFQAEHPG